jgi:hypothetical protein
MRRGEHLLLDSRIKERYRLLMEWQVTIYLACGVAEGLHRARPQRPRIWTTTCRKRSTCSMAISAG